MPVRVHIDDGIAHVRLDRPAKRNGLNPEMFTSIVAAGEQLIDNPSVRAVVLSGEGPSFCAGLDLNAFVAGGTDLIATLLDHRVGPANLAQRVAWVWREVPAPVIAAIHGAAFGGGLQIALGADIRLVEPDARLSVMEVRLGLIPDMGISKTALPHVRPDVLKELTFTGRIVSGTEAVALGLATRVCDDPLADAMALAREISTKNPEAIRGSKALIDGTQALGIEDAFARETALQRPILGSPNQVEAMMANLEKRAPVFADPR